MSTIFPYEFKRKFSTSLYKNLKLSLGEMSFARDFARTKRGDLYPVLSSDGEYTETVGGGKYHFDGRNAEITRLLGGFFPYATYEAVIDDIVGDVGFIFKNDDVFASVTLSKSGENATVTFNESEKECQIFELKDFCAKDAFIVSARLGSFDVFTRKPDGYAVHAVSFASEAFKDSIDYEFFSETVAAISMRGMITLSSVCGAAEATVF